MDTFNNAFAVVLKDKGIISLPPDFGDLIPQTVKEIDLGNNCLTSLPPNMKNLTQLKMLILNNNLLATLPDWLSSFANLRDLRLCGNPLAPLILSLNISKQHLLD